MDKNLTVTTQDGQVVEISVIDVFTVDDFPSKEYIAYTFGENNNNEMIKSYISILIENDDSFRIEAITDKKEWEIVQESFKNLLADNNEGDGDQ